MATEAMVTFDAQGRPAGATASDAETLATLAGATYRAVFTTPNARSLSQLRLWFAMCGLIADNHPADLTKDNVSDTLKIECGHATVWQDAAGFYRRSPKSIAFNALSAEDFSRLLDMALVRAGGLFGEDMSEAVRGELQAMGAPGLRDAANDEAEARRAA
jgi:hypothetical protein